MHAKRTTQRYSKSRQIKETHTYTNKTKTISRYADKKILQNNVMLVQVG